MENYNKFVLLNLLLNAKSRVKILFGKSNTKIE